MAQVSGSRQRQAPYVIPRRPRGNFAQLKELAPPVIIKYKYIPPTELFILLGDASSYTNHHVIASCLIALINPATSTAKKFMDYNDASDEFTLYQYNVDDLNIAPDFKEDTGKVIAYILGYAIVTHLAKSITHDNREYIWNRIKSIGYGAEDANLSESMRTMVASIIDIVTFDNIKANISKAKALIEVLEDALTMTTETTLQVETQKSFELVLSGYGMTATDAMSYFCTLPTKAFIYPIIVDEMREFKAKFKAFKDRHSANWRYGRVLRLEGVSDLDNSKYPHLYTCAIARAQAGRTLGEYKKSSFASSLRESEKTLEAAATTDIVGQGIITDAIAALILEITEKSVPGSHIGTAI